MDFLAVNYLPIKTREREIINEKSSIHHFLPYLPSLFLSCWFTIGKDEEIRWEGNMVRPALSLYHVIPPPLGSLPCRS